ncbi:MAG: hypothetical protein HY235_27230 [Acidobacteria bacterium]|nr:hypothetical protein [Acidobacteriota bacterium]
MRRILLLLACASSMPAHVGSPDVFLEGSAGPYPLFITIRPPVVIPGVAEVEVRVRAKDVQRVSIVPMPMAGAGAKFAPAPDVATRSKNDPQFFTGSLWMMTSGSWQVKVTIDGSEGEGKLAVPVPALANRTRKMQFGLGALLFGLMILLSAGAVSISGAASREAQLEPGQTPGPEHLGRARISMAVTALVVAAILYLGNNWWNVEAGNYAGIIYKPLDMKPVLADGGKLELRLSDPGWLPRKVDDFVPDHNHLMHLFVLRLPEMERVWHLHPEMTASGILTHDLPPMPAGRYALFADVVHENGLPETLVAEIDLPEVAGKPIAGDDSAGAGKPDTASAALADGSRLIWEREFEVYPVKKAHSFRFRVETAEGKPAQDMELYMGMPGHAVFVRRDRAVFAHVHPTGSVPMAALKIAQPDPHAGHNRGTGSLSPVFGFPYGFPQPGDYRMIVQFKRGGAVHTALFDVKVQ